MSSLTDDHRAERDEQGFVIIPGYMEGEKLRRIFIGRPTTSQRERWRSPAAGYPCYTTLALLEKQYPGCMPGQNAAPLGTSA